MAKLNQNYKKLSQNYLFFEIAKRAGEFSKAHPQIEIMKLGIGDTTEPLVPAVVKGLEKGVEEISKLETYTGYGDYQGNSDLRTSLSSFYGKRGVNLTPDEFFISDGAKTDCANITSIFSEDSVVAVSDPVYPVYVDSNIIGGKRIIYMEAKEENGFIPKPPSEHADLVFLCSPNNPTGAVATKEQLKEFVDWALENRAIIIFDAAYSEYIQDDNLPKSIYEIEGAKSCCIEIQSFSKSAGFTGVRLGWTVVPKDLNIEDSGGGEVNQTWNRRQTTMSNGVSNIVQQGGLAVLSEEGQVETKKQVNFYMENARIIKEGLESLGLKCFGGENAPYIWVKTPLNLSSWDFFDKLLNEAHVVCTPGSGFGKMGEGYVRFSAFGHRENIEKAVSSIKENLKL